MKFISLSLENFMRFSEPQTISLEERGLVGVFGEVRDPTGADSNGSGKSSLTHEAVLWCIWGQTRRGLSGDDVVNRDIGENCRVSLLLEDEHNVYRITRTRQWKKAKKKNDLRLEVFMSREELEAGGKDITCGTNTLTQELIDSVLGIDFATFVHSIILTGKTSFCELSDGKQKEILETILNFDIFSKAHKVVKEKIKKAENDLNASLGGLEARREYLQNLKTRREQVITKAAKYTIEKAKKLARACKEKIELDQSVVVVLDDVVKRSGDLSERYEKVRAVKTAGQVLLEERKKAVEAVDSARQTNLDAINAKYWKYEGQVESIEEEQRKIIQVAAAECPTCGQFVDPSHVDQVGMELQEELDEFSSALVKLTAMKKEVNRLAAEDIDAAHKNFDVDEKEYEALVTEEASLMQEILRLPGELQRVQQMEASIGRLTREVVFNQCEEDPFDEMLLSIDEELKECEEGVASLNAEIDETAKSLEYLQFWSLGFSNRGVKSYVFDSVVPFLTERAQKYLDVLTEGTMRVFFDTETTNKDGKVVDKMNIRVLNESGSDVYKGNSDGEKGRINLAVGWALADLACQRAEKAIKFKVLDEPFVNIDGAGIDSIFRLLNSMTDDYETILCVTHNEGLKSRFQEQIKVIKEDNFSRVEV